MSFVELVPYALTLALPGADAKMFVARSFWRSYGLMSARQIQFHVSRVREQINLIVATLEDVDVE